MFVFPMLGLSRRFAQAGYRQPKYMLKLWGETVFHHVIRSFRNYFDTDEFLFICRNDVKEISFLVQVLKELAVHQRLVSLHHPTQGQAQTVALGLDVAGVKQDEELYLFNIDTIRPGFIKPLPEAAGDAWLEVFRGNGEHWSFILPDVGYRVLKTTEKIRVSDLCSDGLYYFRQRRFFDQAYQSASRLQQTTNGEYYIAPLYNDLIAKRLDVRYGLVDPKEVIFCGTPNEYEALLTKDLRYYSR